MRRIASLSVDLDNHWSYLKTHGDPAWEEFPSYLETVVKHVLDFADDIGLTLTAFVVGQDAELSANTDALQMLGSSRHEVGNHSFHHEPWLHLKAQDEIRDEIKRAHAAIKDATGRSPIGFRGPGFSVSETTIRVLGEHGYRYDASTLPTYIGPLARSFYMRNSGLDKAELDRRALLFGKASEGLRPNKPYIWDLDGGQRLVEVPVTTMPLVRLPIHATYLLYIARISERLSTSYLALALGLCRSVGVAPSFLLHSLDFLGPEDASGLEFFPGMDMPGELKRKLIKRYVRMIAARYEIAPLAAHVDSLGDLPTQKVKSLA